VDIGFTDGKIRRLFNDFGLLCDRYGVDLAEIIATRMGVLRGAKHLGLVPQRPPVSLRPVDGSPLAFTVDLAPPRKLGIGALDCGPDPIALERVQKIEVFGVE